MFVIKGRNAGYYNGKSYIHQGDKYAVFTSNISDAKKYKSMKMAENAVRSLLAGCYNVMEECCCSPYFIALSIERLGE